MSNMHLVLLILLLFGAVCDADNSICRKDSYLISEVINFLSVRLNNQIEDGGNFFISPLSISMALAMVYLGARNETKDQMTSSLNFNILGEKCLANKVGEEFRNLILSLNNRSDEQSLLTANGVFVHEGYNVSEYYTTNLEKFFDSNIEFLNFIDEEELSLDKINDWVAAYTNGKIVKLINEPLDRMTIMVLMNAVYFKGNWLHPFPKMSTWTSFFYRNNGTSKVIPFMLQQENLLFYKDHETNHTFLELEYAGGNISMLLVLPRSFKQFPNFNLTSEALCNIRKKLRMVNVMAVIPRFKIEYSRELSKDMINLGMDKLFSDQADLSGIREENDLHVSLMIHKAVIVVDESGTEASAISGVGIDGRMKNREQAAFWADHPFLFYIIHKESDTILFTGRVADP